MSGIFKGSDLLTAQEVAGVLKVKVKTLMNWVYLKKIPFIRFGTGQGSIVRFSPAKLNHWIENFSHDPDNARENKPSKPQKIRQASNKTVEDFNKFAAET